MEEIKSGQKYEAQEDRRNGRTPNRHIEVVSVQQDGKVDVFSVNSVLGTKRRIRIAAKRLASAAYKIIPLILVAALSACAALQTKKPSQTRCNEQPQWTTKDEAGRDVGIYVCFGEESRLLYAVRLLPPAAPKPEAALSAEDQAILAKGRAEVAKMKALTDEGIKRINRVKKPSEEHHSLPTLSGTAK